MLDYSFIGQHLAELRRKSNRTQTELADILCISHQAVSKWERGESMPDIDMFASLADLYNTTIDELIRPGVPAEQTSPVHEKEQSIPLDAANMWQQVLQHIKPRISAPSYNTWFKHTCAEFVEGTIVVHSPNPFTMEWLSARYRSMIEEAISEVTGLTPLALSFDCAKFQYNTAP